MDGDLLVPIALFAMVTAIVLVPRYHKRRERERLYDTLRAAYDKGQPVDPAIIEMLQRGETNPQRTPVRDLRLGVLLLTVAAAFATLGIAIEQTAGHWAGDDFSGPMWPMIGIAAFPGFIGLAYIVFWLVGRGKRASA